MPEVGIDSLDTGVADGCGLSVGATNRARVFWRAAGTLLTAEPSLLPRFGLLLSWFQAK